MKIKFFPTAVAGITGIIFAAPVYAVCPVCVVAVASGFGLSRWFGVDDIISSMWIGAVLWSFSAWTLLLLKTKKEGAGRFNWIKDFKYSDVIIPVFYYAFALIPLYFTEIIGHPQNKVFGIDKIIFGVFLGTAVFLASVRLHNYLKQKNGGKSFFPYQKIVLPVSILIIASLILYKII